MKTNSTSLFEVKLHPSMGEARCSPLGHDGWVVVGVYEVGVVGQPAHAEDGRHQPKHLHYLQPGQILICCFNYKI